ncbi:unnamed protein product, partial [Cuscuta epithymum]
MDLFTSYSVETTTNDEGIDKSTYFMQTLHGRRLAVAVVIRKDADNYDCDTSMSWKKFLKASGCDHIFPLHFENKTELEHKLSRFVHQDLPMTYNAGCPKSLTVHFPDVLQFTLAWFLIDIKEPHIAKIPSCMQRHLFEHTKSEALLVHGLGQWNVIFENFSFCDGFDQFIIDNNILLGGYALFRHIGNFTFEAFVYDENGFSVKPSYSPPAYSFLSSRRPDEFNVSVRSSIPD